MMENFEPTHIDRKRRLRKVQVLDHVVLMSVPHDGLVGILYADSNWKQYVMTLDDFGREYEPIHDPFAVN